jgi:hypothetical protein
MTASFSSRQAQICVLAAGRLVIQRGNPESIGRYLESSHDTVERMLATDDASRWTTQRIFALISFEQQVLGTNTLAEAMVACVSGRPAMMSSRPIERAVMEGMHAVQRFAWIEGEAISDGTVDAAECRELLEAGPKAQAHIATVILAAQARPEVRP